MKKIKLNENDETLAIGIVLMEMKSFIATEDFFLKMPKSMKIRDILCLSINSEGFSIKDKVINSVENLFSTHYIASQIKEFIDPFDIKENISIDIEPVINPFLELTIEELLKTRRISELISESK